MVIFIICKAVWYLGCYGDVSKVHGQMTGAYLLPCVVEPFVDCLTHAHNIQGNLFGSLFGGEHSV